MYNKQLAVAIKVDGKVLRENGDKVFLPFGAEYSILLKNLSAMRASVRVTIDSADALNGKSLIIEPNSDMELTRFVDDLNVGNSFKFIERTANIENHRGVDMADGLIRIEYQFEEPPTRFLQTPLTCPQWFPPTGVQPYWQSPHIEWCYTGATPNLATTQNSAQSVTLSCAATQTANEVGITVAGSINEQKFSVGYIGQLNPTKHVMVLHLLGRTSEEQPIQEAITVKHKPMCATCGKTNVATAKFCVECGTSLLSAA